MISKGDGRMMEVVEYRIDPGQYLDEWFQHDGENVVYLVSGQVTVELDGVGSWDLTPGDSSTTPARSVTAGCWWATPRPTSCSSWPAPRATCGRPQRARRSAPPAAGTGHPASARWAASAASPPPTPGR